MADIPGDLRQLWRDATDSTLPFNERGFIPFQFSSRMTQVNVSQLGGLVPANPISISSTKYTLGMRCGSTHKKLASAEP